MKQNSTQLKNSYAFNFAAFKSFSLVMLLIAAIQITHAQTGYLYIHTKALSKDINQPFTFSVSGGTTTVPGFTLEDQDINIEPSDIGSSHGTGGGELWIVAGATQGADGAIYHRGPNSTVWNNIPGLTGSAIDGADLGHFVLVNTTGDAYLYNGSSFIQIFNHSSFNAKAVDIANNGSITNGVGYTAIVDAGGHVWQYTGDYSSIFTWTDITPVSNSTKPFTRLDVNPSTNDIVLTDATGNVTKVNSAGSALVYYARTASAPSMNNGEDIAVDGNGTMYSIEKDAQGMDAVYRFNGTLWIEEPETGLHYFLTCGDATQVWVIKGFTASQSSSFSNQSTIYTRVGDGSATWLDDERVQTTQNDNSTMIPVAPGTYTITEANVSNWNLQGIIIYDSTAGSTQNVASNSATVVVYAGQVAHILFTNGLVAPTSVATTCGVNTIIQNFGSGANNTRGGALSGLTDFHYYNNASKNTTPDGYYSLTQNSSQWANSTLTDHSGLTGGYFMIINASYAPNQFYKHRITGLVAGTTYVLSFWAANLSTTSPLQPNILAGITDTATGSVLGSVSTGKLPTDNSWHQYTFSFTATVTTADIFLQNNAPGGFGNDLAIDDIGFAGICTTLPVTLINFTAQKQNNNTLLNWSTTSEVNFNHFEIERSADADNWTTIGTVAGHESSNIKQDYTFADQLPLNGINYYRLKLTDMNGTSIYSEVKLVEFNANQWSVSMYPNPVTNSGVVKIQSNQPLQMIHVFDINGKLVLAENITATEVQGNASYTLNTNSLSQGMYFVQMANTNGKTNSLKLVKKD
jgi:type IX secretion system substrate protein